MNVFDYLLLYSLGTIWIVITVNIVLVIGGYIYYTKTNDKKMKEELEHYPFVSIMVPAHNEGIVIEKTAVSLLNLDYPEDRYEVIIINDNSSDNSAEILENVKYYHQEWFFQILLKEWIWIFLLVTIKLRGIIKGHF